MDLANFVEQLSYLVSELGGELVEYPPEPRRYKATHQEKTILWLRLNGENTRTNPPNSIQLFTGWHDDFQTVEAQRRNYWFGKKSADVIARANSPQEVTRAEDFVRLAFRLYASKPMVC